MSTFGKTSKKQSKTSEIIFTPKDFQTEAIKFGLQNPEAGFFLGTGLGKTVVMLVIFHLLKQQGLASKMLVVAKRRIIHNVWPKEVIKWGLPFKVVKVHGTESQRLAALEQEADIYLLTYQGIEWLSRKNNEYKTVEFLDHDTGEITTERVLVGKKIPSELRTQFDILCLDESSMVKNWNAKRSRRLRTMLGTFSRRHILTASPIPKGMMDIFSQIYCLDMGDALGKILGAFRNSFWEPVPREERGRKWDDYELSDDGEERIYTKLKPLVIRFPKDVLKLPPLYRIERLVQLSPDARKIYRELEEDYITILEGGAKITAANAGVATQKLRQITGGAVYRSEAAYDDANAALRRERWEHVHNEKIDDLGELIEELQGEPLLVAYEFDHERQRIQKKFPSIPHIGGGTSDADADMLIDQWNAGELPVLLGHPDSIAHGLNLQESGYNICFFGIGWNYENHTQFIDRVYRQGQEHAVWVYLLVAEDTVDEAIITVLGEREADQERLFAAIQTHLLSRKTDMHDWKNVKLPAKLPTGQAVAEAFLARHTAKWIPTWDHNLEDSEAAYALAASIMTGLGGWLPSKHAAFQNEVLRTKAAKETELISLLFNRTQAIMFRCLRLSTVDAERPITAKGKLGAARIYISNEPSYTKTAWPHRKDLDMKAATTKTKTAPKTKAAPKSKAAPKAKAKAKAKSAPQARATLFPDTSKLKMLVKPDSTKLRGGRLAMLKLIAKLDGKTFDKVKAAISKVESKGGIAQVPGVHLKWMQEQGFFKVA